MRIRAAFDWLTTRNPYYEGITWNETTAQDLAASPFVPDYVAITHAASCRDGAELPRYTDKEARVKEEANDFDLDSESEDEVKVENGAVMEVDANGASRPDRRAAVAQQYRAAQEELGFPVPSASTLSSQFESDTLPKTFQTLYPYGTGCFDDTVHSALMHRRTCSNTPERSYLEAISVLLRKHLNGIRVDKPRLNGKGVSDAA